MKLIPGILYKSFFSVCRVSVCVKEYVSNFFHEFTLLHNHVICSIRQCADDFVLFIIIFIRKKISFLFVCSSCLL